MEGEATEPQTLIEQLTTQVADLNRQLGIANGERDGYRVKYRTATHKGAFSRAIEAAKADPAAVEALWRLHGYEAETDEPTPEQIAALVETAKKESPFAFLRDEPAPTPAPAADPNRKPDRLNQPTEPPRGKGPPSPASKFQVTRKQLADGRWMRENQAKVLEAMNAGTYELV